MFMDEHVYPAEAVYDASCATPATPTTSRGHGGPQAAAREAGLWKMRHSDPEYGSGLSNSDYAPLAEPLGHSFIASRPPTARLPSNMGALPSCHPGAEEARPASPLLEGEIRSASR